MKNDDLRPAYRTDKPFVPLVITPEQVPAVMAAMKASREAYQASEAYQTSKPKPSAD